MLRFGYMGHVHPLLPEPGVRFAHGANDASQGFPRLLGENLQVGL